MAGGYSYVGGGQDQAVLIKNLNVIARCVAGKYGLIDKQVNSRVANLLKNRYRIQIVFKITEAEYMMFKMTGQLDEMTIQINRQASVMPGMPNLGEPLEITWENPAFSTI